MRAQEDDLGCLIAAAAMVFDLTYKQAAMIAFDPMRTPNV
jgi:hypothetical protein